MKLLNLLLISSSLTATYIQSDYINPYKLHESPKPDPLICKLNNKRKKWSLDDFKSSEEFTPILDSIASKLHYHLPLSKEEISRNFIEQGLNVEKYNIQYFNLDTKLESAANDIIYNYEFFGNLGQFNMMNYKVIDGDKLAILFVKVKDYEKFDSLKCDDDYYF
ncbi:hypothetical protein CONCODRAFT_67601 [Conidiobolus coronatus NRRL 28638]|uniref:Uncharacterized protein n=1 Tax=Conidiobolus coronatus (strain ATCC 28846 / CBS 209.66 / NRRL 28638) TaxID=796925 RepID=A0A137PGZ3_CONC2|nr:hypothetical protein CONCODRAFT_67601 [Conidiobolus coronatus NRRL 28638]|eukprot:KXN74258.1 hypothetical protein CONCODRAFT_67601 [Conidiobolus coronatus NRRL 28638]